MRLEPFATRNLPSGLRALADQVRFLAADLRWTWSHAGEALWKHFAPHILLENEIIPLFYARDAAGIPRNRVKRMRASMAKLAPEFSVNRMLRDYVEQLYLPAARAVHARTAEQGRLARELYEWDKQLRQHWSNLHLGKLTVHETADVWRFELHVYLGEISPAAVQIQLYVDPLSGSAPLYPIMQQGASIPGASNGYVYVGDVARQRPYNEYRLHTASSGFSSACTRAGREQSDSLVVGSCGHTSVAAMNSLYA